MIGVRVDPATIPEDRRAPDGSIWVCCACGKTAQDRYGMMGQRSRGWDESCTVNAQAFPVERLEYDATGRVCAIRETGTEGKADE